MVSWTVTRPLPSTFLSIHYLPQSLATLDTIILYCHVYGYEWLYIGFGSVIGLIELLQLVTTSKDYALTVRHASQITTGHAVSSQSVTLFTRRCLVAASSDGHFLLVPELSPASAISFS
jgi:hypothetical protein